MAHLSVHAVPIPCKAGCQWCGENGESDDHRDSYLSGIRGSGFRICFLPGGVFLVETTADGAIVLRPAAVYPVEIYSQGRIAEFERENAVSPELLAKVDRVAAKKKRG